MAIKYFDNFWRVVKGTNTLSSAYRGLGDAVDRYLTRPNSATADNLGKAFGAYKDAKEAVQKLARVPTHGNLAADSLTILEGGEEAMGRRLRDGLAQIRKQGRQTFVGRLVDELGLEPEHPPAESPAYASTG